MCAMVPLMSALSLYPPSQSGQQTLVSDVTELGGTFEDADDPPASYPVSKRTCIPCKPVVEFHWDRTSVS